MAGGRNSACRQSSHGFCEVMGEFFANVTRYPRYLIAFGLGVASSVFEPLLARTRNPVTAVALIGALISGLLTLTLVLRAMVTPVPLT